MGKSILVGGRTWVGRGWEGVKFLLLNIVVFGRLKEERLASSESVVLYPETQY